MRNAKRYKTSACLRYKIGECLFVALGGAFEQLFVLIVLSNFHRVGSGVMRFI